MPIVRQARLAEAGTLTRLATRSKAHWGYDEDFMRQCTQALTVTAEAIAEGRVWVVEVEGVVGGVASVAHADASSAASSAADFELAHLFVDPGAMGQGLGRLLFDRAIAWVGDHGGNAMEILADPDAVPFYLRMGAVRIGDAPSDAIPGRRLPLLLAHVTVGGHPKG